MKVVNAENISVEKIEQITQILPNAENLLQLITWINLQLTGDFLPQIVAEVVVQDEFMHDVVIPYNDVFLVFDTT